MPIFLCTYVISHTPQCSVFMTHAVLKCNWAVIYCCRITVLPPHSCRMFKISNPVFITQIVVFEPTASIVLTRENTSCPPNHCFTSRPLHMLLTSCYKAQVDCYSFWTENLVSFHFPHLFEMYSFLFNILSSLTLLSNFQCTICLSVCIWLALVSSGVCFGAKVVGRLGTDSSTETHWKGQELV